MSLNSQATADQQPLAKLFLRVKHCSFSVPLHRIREEALKDMPAGPRISHWIKRLSSFRSGLNVAKFHT